MIVEDDTELYEVLKEALSEICRTHNAQSLSEAKEALESKDFDLILCDRALPDGDGFDIKSTLNVDSSVPVIFVSGFSSIEDKVVGYARGAQDYIGKPFDPRELRLKIRRYLEKS